jgi:hypothetical protein
MITSQHSTHQLLVQALAGGKMLGTQRGTPPRTIVVGRVVVAVEGAWMIVKRVGVGLMEPRAETSSASWVGAARRAVPAAGLG